MDDPAALAAAQNLLPEVPVSNWRHDDPVIDDHSGDLAERNETSRAPSR
jgi:hypothetical protein